MARLPEMLNFRHQKESNNLARNEFLMNMVSQEFEIPAEELFVPDQQNINLMNAALQNVDWGPVLGVDRDSWLFFWYGNRRYPYARDEELSLWEAWNRSRGLEQSREEVISGWDALLNYENGSLLPIAYISKKENGEENLSLEFSPFGLVKISWRVERFMRRWAYDAPIIRCVPLFMDEFNRYSVDLSDPVRNRMSRDYGFSGFRRNCYMVGHLPSWQRMEQVVSADLDGVK